MNEINDALFDYIDNKHKSSLEKIKLLIHQFQNQTKQKEVELNTKETEYIEKFASKRKIQNEMYDAYVQERQLLYNDWKLNNSKNALFDMLNMEFHYENVPDIYTYEKGYKKPDIQTKTKTDVKDDIKDAKDTKPKDTKPKDTKPKDTKPKDTKPKDTKPKDTKPKDAKPKDTKPKDTKSKDAKPILRTGIPNPRNSCYINATIQSLVHLPEFNNLLSANKDHNDIVKAYVEIYKAYINNKVANKNVSNLIKALNEKLIKNETFSVKYQEDAFEFVIKLIEKIHMQELDELFKVNFEISRIFEKEITKNRKTLKCEDIKQPVNESNNTLILEIDDTNITYNIKDEINKKYDGIREEITDKSNYLKCEKVKNVKNNKDEPPTSFPFTLIEKITTFPQILRVTLNIFDKSLTKHFIKTQIPNKWIYANNEYTLNGIVCHIGSTMKSGHYIYLSLEKNEWIEYSDTQINPHNTTVPYNADSYYKLDNTIDENTMNIFNTDENIPCPYVLYYIKNK
jgi:ubiquitin C-terminal hydrolase